jgi:hypothetical protein
MIKIFDADDRLFNDIGYWKDYVELVAIEEIKDSPHIFRVYKWKKHLQNKNDLTLLVRDKHLAQQEFNSVDTARELLFKFTLKGKQHE